MDGIVLVIDHEVVDEAAVRGKRLSPHARRTRQQVRGTQRWHVALERPEKACFAEVTVHFGQPGAPELCRQPLEAAVAERLAQIADVDVEPAVALTCECQYRVRPEPDRAVDPPRKMHPQKREARIWHGVDQPSDQIAPLGAQDIVIAPEGNDPWGFRRSRELRDSVGIESRAADNVPRRYGAAGGDKVLVSISSLDRVHAVVAEDGAAACDYQFRVLRGNARKVDNTGGWRPQRLDAGDTWLDLVQSLRPDQFQAGHGIGQPTLIKVLEPGQFLGLCRDDHFAAELVRDRMLVTETEQAALAGHAGPRFEGTGGVIDAGVNHPTVMPALMLRDPRLLFEHHQA